MPGKPTRRQEPTVKEDPWTLVWGQPYIDADKLVSALEYDLKHDLQPDFRKRLLVRDALKAVRSFWGSDKYLQWLDQSPAKEKIVAILGEKLGKQGYHGIRKRLVTSMHKEQLEQVFEALGTMIRLPIDVYIAGSIPTLLKGLTVRPTDDIDFVDEVPAQIRDQRTAIKKIKERFGLALGHVQSHYLPAEWMNRCVSMGEFGGLRVHLVDEYDIFVRQLSSKQEKHKDDLRVLAPKLNKDRAKDHLLKYGAAFLESKYDRPTIEANWQFIYREPLSFK
jgi:hypothetical protein